MKTLFSEERTDSQATWIWSFEHILSEDAPPCLPWVHYSVISNWIRQVFRKKMWLKSILIVFVIKLKFSCSGPMWHGSKPSIQFLFPWIGCALSSCSIRNVKNVAKLCSSNQTRIYLHLVWNFIQLSGMELNLMESLNDW